MLPSWPVPFVDVAVAPYGLVRAIAVVACAALALALNRRQGIAASITILMVLIGIPAGIGAARLLDMAEYGREYASLDAAAARNGSSIYGAFIAAAVVAIGTGRCVRVPPLAVLDAAGPALALSEAITRIGCFCAGCCYGVPWTGPWAVVFPAGSFAFADMRMRGLLGVAADRTPALHPVQLYATAIMALVALALYRRFPRRAHLGEVFAWFLIAYGGERLLLAPFRMEVLASMKALSAVFIAVGVSGLALGWRRGPVRRRSPSPAAAAVR